MGSERSGAGYGDQELGGQDGAKSGDHEQGKPAGRTAERKDQPGSKTSGEDDSGR